MNLYWPQCPLDTLIRQGGLPHQQRDPGKDSRDTTLCLAFFVADILCVHKDNPQENPFIPFFFTISSEVKGDAL